MPNLPMHIYLAHQVAESLDSGSVFDHIGSFYLGSTTPDIRAMTKWSRERTHFAQLSVEEVGTGARTMFQQYPDLADAANLAPVTLAFVLGYLSHLVADEVWITSMFRPNFDGPDMVTESEVEAHIWDRALQLDMDRKSLVEMGNLKKASEAISCSDSGVDIGFIESDTLAEWREWVQRFIGWDFDWQRLKRALNRVYRDDEGVQQTVDVFLAEMPRSLERVYQQIPEETINAYHQQALDQTIMRVREYLNGA